jgi:hypothetical protein
VVVGESQVLEGGRGGTADGAPGTELAVAVRRLRRELTAHRPMLPDRAVAEDELDALARDAADADRAPGPVDSERMRHSLLLVAAVLGSVSALAAPLGELRVAVERLAPPLP